MELHVIGTGSKGNCYLLESEKETLIIECGVQASEIKKALNFNLHKVVGCILTHEHNDHAKSILDLMNWGVNIYASQGTLKSKRVLEAHRANIVKKNKAFRLGEFKIVPFDVKHDAAEPFGFLIEHPDCGKTLFITDTYYVEYLFPGLNNIIIEANYCEDIINEKLGVESGKMFLRNRIISSHFSLKSCKELLDVNNLESVHNIVLIHLSDSNSNEERFKNEVMELTGKTVTVAQNGMKLNFNKSPF